MGNYSRNSYHGNYPEWRNTNKLTGDYVGIELEVVSRTSSYQSILRALPNFSGGRKPLAEQDASLSYNRGVELIFPPVRYRQLKSPNSVVARAMEAIKRTTVPRLGAGMHININTKGWTPEKKKVFCGVFHGLPKENIRRLGGRPPTVYCRQRPKLDVTRVGADYSRGCTAIHTSRIELRFPRGTTSHKKLVEIMEFVQAAEKFSQGFVKSAAFGSTERLECAHLEQHYFRPWLKAKKRYKKLYERVYGTYDNSNQTV